MMECLQLMDVPRWQSEKLEKLRRIYNLFVRKFRLTGKIQ